MFFARKFVLIGLIAVSAFAEDYHFPAPRKNWHNYLRTTFGPFALLTTGVGAGVEQLNNSAPEWGQGVQGYGIRYGDVFGRLLVQNTIQYGAATVLREDPNYYRCECSGLFKRTGHALISTFTARRPSGKRTLAISAIVGAYGGGMISTFWYPHRYTPLGDGVRIANYGFASTFGINVATEFWPEVRRKIFKK
ncbi:MAG: hypothetical protein ACR2NN_27000 [Bryobacteraceae bacterium]